MMKQNELAKRLNITAAYVSQIISEKKRPMWPLAKRIAEETDTDPVLWLEGRTDDMRKALENAN